MLIPQRALPPWLLAALLNAVASPLFGQTTYDWIDPAGGLFQDAGNWSPNGGPPGSLDTARFNQNDSYIVSFNASRTNQFLHVALDDVLLDLGGHTYTLTGNYPTVIVGMVPGDVSVLTVQNGTWVTNWTALALGWPTSQAFLFLPGNVTWQNSGAIYIGGAGFAEVEATDGADVTCSWTAVGASGGGSGRLEVLDAGTTWTCSDSVMVVGGESNGTLIVANGGQVASAWGEIGTQGGVSGIATIVGAGSRWEMPGSVTAVGGNGIGILSIANGGLVTSSYASMGVEAGGYGSVSVSGVDSAWNIDTNLTIGQSGTGDLDVGVNGSVTAERVLMTLFPGSSGILTVDGNLDIEADGSYLYVGYAGAGEATISGTLTVNDPGGTVGGDDGFAIVGSSAGATGLLTINAGGTLDLSAQLQLGALAGSHGEVVINAGGTAVSRLAASSPSGAAGNVGRDGVGIMTIAGGLWNCLDAGLNIGFGAGSNGTMNVTDGGQALSIGGGIGRVADATGTVLIDGAGSNWTSSAPINVGVGGTGALTVVGGGFAEAPEIVIGAGGVAGGTGTLDGDVSNGGSVRPGDRPGPGDVGTLTIDGDYTQTEDGTLVIDVGGAASGQYDVLMAAGVIDLAGTLQVNLVSGFQPSGGEQLVIIANGFVLNSFDDVVSPVYVNVAAQETFVVLTFCPTADVNCDTFVNQLDVDLFVAALLTGQACDACDIDGDEAVDGGDVQPFTQAFLAP
ncbi:MAG TPA: hypothetical protein VNT79_08040 [Phycisphaerae bacterium]|nr:hypothetical protein [Phycisphaerae bacterium]